MGSVSVSSCRCCMFVSCVHLVAVLNAAFCKVCFYIHEQSVDIKGYTYDSTHLQHCYMDVRHGQFLWLCRKKIEAFETWLYKRMLRISWEDMVTNEEVYRQMNIKQSLLVNIVHRCILWQFSMLRSAKSAFTSMSKVLTSRDIHMTVRIYNTAIWM